MAPQSSPLQPLFDRGAVWQARGHNPKPAAPEPSGHDRLDALLDGGWQPGNLVELLYDHEGSGELRLLLPLLARLSQQPRWLLWVDPPHIPYPAALSAAGIDTRRILMVHSKRHQDRLWVLEQGLKSGTCSAVLGWPGPADAKAIRRLQLAAADGGGLGFLFRPREAEVQSSPAPYRVALAPRPQGVAVSLLKRRQGWAQPPRVLSLGEERLLDRDSPLRLV